MRGSRNGAVRSETRGITVACRQLLLWNARTEIIILICNHTYIKMISIDSCSGTGQDEPGPDSATDCPGWCGWESSTLAL